MKPQALEKIGGICVVTGGLLLALYAIAFATLLPMAQARRDFTQLVLSANWGWITTSAFAGIVLLMFGFAVAYARMFATAGVTGFVGIVLVEIAYLFQASKVTWEMFLYPIITRHAGSAELLSKRLIAQDAGVGAFRMVASLTILVGIVCFCTALIRSRVYPRSAGALILAGAVLYGLGPLLSPAIALTGIAIFAAGCVVLGARLHRGS